MKSLSVLRALFLLLVILNFSLLANAEDKVWFGGTGSWDDPSNWSPYGIPGNWPPGDDVNMTNQQNISATSYFSGVPAQNQNSYYFGKLQIYGTGAATMTLSISAGYLGALGGSEIGNNGIVNQTGGSFRSGDSMLVSAGGTYNLQAGSMGIGASPAFGISGVFNQSGGSVGAGPGPTLDSFEVNQGGVYNLSGGTLSYDYGASNVRAGGVFNQSGGIVSGPGMIVAGTYNLSAGELTSHQPNTRNYISGGTFNQSGGTVSMAGDVSRPLYVGYDDGITKTAGTYNLSGGRLETTGIVVVDKFNYSGGELALSSDTNGHWGTGTLTNNGTTSLSGTGTRVIEGNIVNNGTFKTTNTIASYTGNFTNNGAYISDPAAQHFNDLIVGQNGYLKGGLGDFFFVSGDFKNQSTMNTVWNTSFAYLGFEDGANPLHGFYLAGQDYGAVPTGYKDNFSWGFLDLKGDILQLYDGNNIAGGALYAGDLWGLQVKDFLIMNIIGMDGLNIYYLANLGGNEYLHGLEYDLTGGGHLIPIGTASVPEPATMFLLACGLTGLGILRRRGKR